MHFPEEERASVKFRILGGWAENADFTKTFLNYVKDYTLYLKAMEYH